MATRRRKNQFKSDTATGFGTQAANNGSRLVHRDGTPNTMKTGVPFFEKISWYHTLIKMPRWKFILLVFTVFMLVNLLFAFIYLALGIDRLNGITAKTGFEKFWQTYFFSIQTFTTVGYGHISPREWDVSFVAAVQAFCGLMSFALATGLLYGRFAIPKAYIRFSDFAVVAPYENINGLMFRMVPFKNSHISDAEVKLSLSMVEDVNGKPTTQFYQLPVEIERINSLVLSWTVVHPINENSPLYGLTADEVTNSKAELLVFLRGFDETFSNTVISRTSYRFDEWKFGQKFIPMYQYSEEKEATVIEVSKLSSTRPAALNRIPETESQAS
jgi:inward rectifier potassium channel